MRLYIRVVLTVVWLVSLLAATAQRTTAAAPTLTSLSPSRVAVGSQAFTLTVNGSGFTAASIVRWNGSDRPTTYLSATQVNAAIPASNVAAGGSFSITVFNPGSGASAPLSLPSYTRSGLDTLPDGVFGQPDFSTFTSNNPLLPGGANRISGPSGVAVDPQSGRLFVADWNNNRVLSWPNVPIFANGQPADLVLGQPDFTTYTSNPNEIGPNTLRIPESLAVDGAGNLYVADWGNSRVLEYDAPLVSGAAASRVFGQPDMYSNFFDPGPSPSTLFGPIGVALDRSGNLYVADAGYNRVLEYDAPLENTPAAQIADRVYGQPDLYSGTPNNGGLNASSLRHPTGLALDAAGNLYVADTNNHRVLEYNAPLTTDIVADHVFGQPTFTTATPNFGGSVSATSLNLPWGLAIDHAGSLYVVDSVNQRLLEYTQPLVDATADRVFGQPGFTSSNHGTETGLYDPFNVAMDRRGSLYLSDYRNARVLVYDGPPLLIFLPEIHNSAP